MIQGMYVLSDHNFLCQLKTKIYIWITVYYDQDLLTHSESKKVKEIDEDFIVLIKAMCRLVGALECQASFMQLSIVMNTHRVC